ncbi:hypothetical protein VCHA40O235_90160 [Vibrio chagasii]|nr:hypothetical protein VCHA40O235_90160 [Vibrio chagasii]
MSFLLGNKKEINKSGDKKIVNSALLIKNKILFLSNMSDYTK